MPRRGIPIATASVLLAVFWSTPLRADPCSVHWTTARHVFPGGDEPQIRMVSERIEVEAHLVTSTYSDGERDDRPGFRHDSVSVSIDYEFQNLGEAKDVIMGFPIRLSGPRTLEGFRVEGQGVGDRVKPTREKVLGALKDRGLGGICAFDGYLDRQPLKRVLLRGDQVIVRARYDADGIAEEHFLGWYFWTQHFDKGQTRIKTSYRHPREHNQCQVHLILKTASHWGEGIIPRLAIVLKERGLLVRGGQPRFVPYRAQLCRSTRESMTGRCKERIEPKETDPVTRTMTWEQNDFRAVSDVVLKLPRCNW